jgi:hypothetical protein
MEPFVLWLRSSALSEAINTSRWVWPLSETLHFVGLTLVIGIAGFFDLRLMGFMKRVPISAARELMPFAIGGFVLNLITGVIFLVGLPEQYFTNPAFLAKVLFIAAAGTNALFFERIVGPATFNAGPGAEPPRAAKVVGAVSLFSWFAVLYCGRMLPYLGNAY